MQASEWGMCRDPMRMLQALQIGDQKICQTRLTVTERQLRLVAAAIWRSISVYDGWREEHAMVARLAEGMADGVPFPKNVDPLPKHYWYPLHFDASAALHRELLMAVEEDNDKNAGLMRDVVGDAFHPLSWSDCFPADALPVAVQDVRLVAEDCYRNVGADGFLLADSLRKLRDACLDAGCRERVACRECGGTGYGKMGAYDATPPVCWRCSGEKSFANPLLRHLDGSVREYKSRSFQHWYSEADPLMTHLTPESAKFHHCKGCWAVDLCRGIEVPA